MTGKPKKMHLGWFNKAKEDELSIKAVLKEGHPSTGCFLAQQMAEKYLKGLMVFLDRNFPKVHDLLELETLLLDAYPDIKAIHPDLELLNRYYIETRYPGDYPEFSKEECRQSYKAACRVQKFVLHKVVS